MSSCFCDLEPELFSSALLSFHKTFSLPASVYPPRVPSGRVFVVVFSRSRRSLVAVALFWRLVRRRHELSLRVCLRWHSMRRGSDVLAGSTSVVLHAPSTIATRELISELWRSSMRYIGRESHFLNLDSSTMTRNSNQRMVCLPRINFTLITSTSISLNRYVMSESRTNSCLEIQLAGRKSSLLDRDCSRKSLADALMLLSELCSHRGTNRHLANVFEKSLKDELLKELSELHTQLFRNSNDPFSRDVLLFSRKRVDLENKCFHRAEIPLPSPLVLTVVTRVSSSCGLTRCVFRVGTVR